MQRTLRSSILLASLATFTLTRVAVAQDQPPQPQPSPPGQQPQPGQPAPPSPAPPEQPPPDGDDAGAEEIPAEEMPVEEAGAEDAEPKPDRAAPKGKGVVWGVITDLLTKEPILDAQVSVPGTKFKAIADLDGRFRLELPPGNYELRVFYEMYKAKRVQSIRVVAGALQKIDVTMELDRAVEEVMEVEAAPERASAAAQMMIRKNASYSADAVGAQDIAKTPDRNAAEAAKRVVGATVVGGKYVYVRGLGDRYSNALLNGVPLPSPDPDRQAVPLDLFPSIILSDLTVAKTFTPDMPADFAGGSVRINTRELPDKLLLQGSFTISSNTESTFGRRLTYQGGGMDWLGIDSGVRALPSEIPDYRLKRLGPKPDGTTITSDELATYGRLLNAYMSTRETFNLPNMSGSAVIGNSHQLGGDQMIGYTLALTYGRRFTNRNDEILQTFGSPNPDGTPHAKNEYTADTGIDAVSWGALGTATYKPGKNHSFTVTGMHSRNSENEARIIGGFNDDRQTDIADTRLRFNSRSLTFGQVAAEHVLPPLNRALLGYNFGLSLATSDEPDTRQTVYTYDAPSNTYAFDEGINSGSHFFADQTETRYGGGLDWTQPVVSGEAPSKLKFGGLFSRRSREFKSRRFAYDKDVPNSPAFRLPPDELFVDENIGTILELSEKTTPSDAYDAAQNLYAAYVMADASLTSRVRAIVGGRLEANKQTIDSRGAQTDEPVHGEIDEVDLLPAVALVFATTKTSNLRMSATRTVARPQLRELAPTLFQDYFGARPVTGNPNLQQTDIYNADLRFEIFPGAAEVLALSVFYKEFIDPIEQVILPTGGLGFLQWQNSEGAYVAGIELEARKTLGFVDKALTDFTVLFNLTLARSRVKLDVEGELNSVQTNDVRPLAGQSPYVVNVGLDYSREESGTRARLVYNIAGARIYQVGSDPLPDIYEQPRHALDLTVGQKIGKHVELKGTAENIINDDVLFTHDEDVLADDAYTTNRYSLGRTFSLGVTVTY